MPDARISELTAATTLNDADLAPIVQTAGGTSTTRRTSIAQLRGQVLADRGVHVRDYGAKGDGTTNDAPAIQAAINDVLSRGGGIVQLGPRAYRLASAITISSSMVRLQGAGFTEAGDVTQGTRLIIDQTTFNPIRFTGVAARGSAVADLAVMQTHSTSFTAGWAATDYPYVFRVEDCLGGVDFDNVLLGRVNRGIYCRNSGRLDIRRLRGQVFRAGVEIDECLDVPRIHNLHFWTFWSANENVVRWQQANGDAVIIRRCDGIFIDQAFALGYRSMFRFANSAVGAPPERSGAVSKFYIANAYADFVRHGVWIEANGVDGRIGSLTTQGEIFAAGGPPVAGANGILIDASGARIQVGNLRIDDAEDNAIRVNGTDNRLDIFALRCAFFNTRNNGAAAVHLADSAASPANAVFLGTPALLENGNGGPLVNTGTNGFVQMQAPAGRTVRPGLAVGAQNTGFFSPGTGILAASAAGAEVLRGTAGTVTLGGAPGSHGLEVTTPANATNRLVANGAAAGGAVSLQAQGTDANIALELTPKGTGTLRGPTPPLAENSTALATTAWVRAQGYGGGGGAVSSVAGRTGAVTLTVADIAGAVARAGDTMTGPLLANGGGGGNAARLSGAPAGATPGSAVFIGVDAAASADANVSVVLGAPKGIGWISAQLPDSTTAGGNNRGTGAVDWQTSRTGVGQVASGTNATIAGGLRNTASAANASIGGGQANTASGTNTAIAGGQSNTASGNFSWAPGGLQADARSGYGKGVWASGQIAALGDAQAGEQVLRRQGSDGSAIRLTADNANPGTGNTVNLPNNGTYLVRMLVVARQTGGAAGTLGDSAGWEVTALVRRGANAASTAIVGGGGSALAPLHADAGAAAWRLTVLADPTGGGLAVSGTGEASKTVQWVARILSVEAAG